MDRNCYVTEKGSVSDLPQEYFLQSKPLLKELLCWEPNTINKLVNTDSELRHLAFNELLSLHSAACLFHAALLLITLS